jgi:CheY-like chemotaxis protein
VKVLLVDDEEDIRKIGRLSLEVVGKFETLVASNAREALRFAEEKQPDVILMDMMMPEMDGLAALEALKRNPAACHIPVVFVTAKVQAVEIQRYLRLGAKGVIRKPFDPMALPTDLLRILAG